MCWHSNYTILRRTPAELDNTVWGRAFYNCTNSKGFIPLLIFDLFLFNFSSFFRLGGVAPVKLRKPKFLSLQSEGFRLPKYSVSYQYISGSLNSTCKQSHNLQKTPNEPLVLARIVRAKVSSDMVDCNRINAICIDGLTHLWIHRGIALQYLAKTRWLPFGISCLEEEVEKDFLDCSQGFGDVRWIQARCWDWF